MKRFFLFALIATVFVACSTDATQDLAPEIPTAPDELHVSFDEEVSRIQLGENGSPVWTKGDLVSVFYKSDGNDCYKFTGATGDRSGTLMRTSVGEWSRRGNNVVVVYPYNKDYIISLASNTVEASLPAEQTYLADSYGVGSSLMIASGDYKQFALKNVCGWLKLQFTGSGYVSKIILRGNNGEQVAGNLLVCADDASCILAEASADINNDEVGGALITDGDILTEVTLNCGDGVALNPETPTAFYIALPPQTFEKGITIDVLWTDGSKMTKSVTNSLTIERNHIVPMASIPVQPTPPDNEIWYTSSTGNIVTPYKTGVFGATILSNTYEDGKGIIKFNGNVTEVGYDAFYNCDALTSVTIPNSVTKIGNYAFWGCDALESITIPDSVTSIGKYAFSSCKALKSVTIGNSVISIGSYAFEDCDALTSINIPNSVTSIGEWAFSLCSALKSVTIGDSVTEIGSHAFRYCDALTSVTIPNSVTSIGNCAFKICRALTSFYGKFASEDNRCLIVDGVLNSFAPAGLTTYTIPNNVTSIGKAAFDLCEALKSITIPNSVTSIGSYAFDGCSALKSITIPNSVTSIGECAFAHCYALKSVTIPNSVTSIGEYAFYNCSALESFYGKFASEDNRCLIIDSVLHSFAPAGLTSYTIPNSVTSIGNRAFEHCSAMKSITIPNSVTSIGKEAFYSCKALTEVYCKPTTPPTADLGGYQSWDAFYGNASGRKIYAPTASVDAYKTAEYWSDYASDIEPYEFTE